MRSIPAVVVLLSITVCSAFANAETVPTNRPASLRFKQSNDAESKESCLSILDNYYALVRDARKALKDTKLGLEGRVYAIYLLGQLRAEEAVPDLLDIIDLDAEPIMRYTAIQWHGRFPAQVALTKIGMPAVREISKRLPSESSAEKQKLFCTVVRDVLGQKPGRMYLEFELPEQAAGLSADTRKSLLDAYDAAATPRPVK